MNKAYYMHRFELLPKTDPARKLLFSKVLDRFFLCAEQGACTFSDFLDPFTCAAFEQILGAAREAETRAFGGAFDSERRILGFAPHADMLTDSVFPIARLRAVYNTKFHSAPRHKDLLGAVLGLGIDRNRIGDIVLSPQYADMLVHEEISGFILDQLEKAGKTPVKLTRVTTVEETERIPEAETALTVASLRLDAVIAAAFRLSRARAIELITADKVFVNWNPVADAGKSLKEGDAVTVRGQGRVSIVEISNNRTKKDRIRLTAAVLK